MKRATFISFTICGLVVLWFGIGFFRNSSKIEVANEKQTLTHVRVEDLVAQPHRVYFTIRGITTANHKVILRAETDGPVEKIFADRGKVVKKGEPILKLFLKDRSAKLLEAEAKAASKQIEYNAALTLSEKGFTPKISLAQAKARLEESKAQLLAIKTSIADTVIKAPFTGILDDRTVEVGSYVNVGDTVATIIDLNLIRSVIAVSEKQISSLKLGQRGKIYMTDGKTFEGEICYIGRVADPKTRTFRVELISPNPDYTIPDGMAIEVRIPIYETNAHFISPAILSLDTEGNLVLKMINEQNQAHIAPIQMIDTQSDGIWISGIPEKATVIITGQEFIQDGETVKPIREKRAD